MTSWASLPKWDFWMLRVSYLLTLCEWLVPPHSTGYHLHIFFFFWGFQTLFLINFLIEV